MDTMIRASRMVLHRTTGYAYIVVVVVSIGACLIDVLEADVVSKNYDHYYSITTQICTNNTLSCVCVPPSPPPSHICTYTHSTYVVVHGPNPRDE